MAAQHFEKADSTAEVGRPLSRLLDHIGRPGQAVALTLAAYLAGSFWVSTTVRMSTTFAKKAVSAHYERDAQGWPKYSAWRPFTDNADHRLVAFVGADGSVWGHRLDPDEQHKALAGIARDVIFGQGRALLAGHRDIYSEFDRMHAEAEMRDAVVLPALVLLAGLLLNVSLPAVTEAAIVSISLAFIGVLWREARALYRDAWSFYAHAIAEGSATCQTIQMLEQRKEPFMRK